MADDKIIIGIEVDSSGVAKNVNNVKQEIEKTVGPAEKLKTVLSESFNETRFGGFFQSLKGMSAGFAAATAAAATLGATIKTALAGEEILRINKQFEILSENAGLIGGELRDALEKATGGKTDLEDVLKSSSEAIIALGVNANRLPETFELATKAVKVFGGDAVERFELINNAIASTSAKQLKQIGIVLDSDKIFKDYEKTIGAATGTLTVQQKQFALLNATIATAGESYKKISTDTESLSGSFKKLGVSASDVFDDFAISVSTVFGPALKALVDGITFAINKFKSLISTTDLVTGASQTNATVLKELQEQYAKNEQLRKGFINPALAETYRKENEVIKEQIAALQALIDKNAKAKSGQTGADPNGLTPEQIAKNAQDRLNFEKQFQADSLALKQKALSDNIAIANTIQDEQLKNQELDRLSLQQQALEKEAHLIRTAEIEKRYASESVDTTAMKNSLIKLDEDATNKEIERLKEESGARQAAFEKKQVEESKKNAFNMRAALASGITSGIQSMITAMKNGENAASAFGKALLGIFGDMAIQLGAFFIYQGLAVESLKAVQGAGAVAAGVALVALGALIKSMTSGGGSAAAPVATGAGGVPGSATDTQSQEAIQEKQTQVKIDVQGTVLSPIEVGKQIAQILNDTFDATGTKVVTA